MAVNLENYKENNYVNNIGSIMNKQNNADDLENV
jgi:hypothetical protein